jgi:hypothetical protein
MSVVSVSVQRMNFEIMSLLKSNTPGVRGSPQTAIIILDFEFTKMHTYQMLCITPMLVISTIQRYAHYREVKSNPAYT